MFSDSLTREAEEDPSLHKPNDSPYSPLCECGTAPQSPAYRAFLNRRAIPDYQSVPGDLSVHILERAEGEVTLIVTLTFWESLEAIKGFAGDAWRSRSIILKIRTLSWNSRLRSSTTKGPGSRSRRWLTPSWQS